MNKEIGCKLLYEKALDYRYNPFRVYCRELALGTVSLTGDRAQGDDSKHESHYNDQLPVIIRCCADLVTKNSIYIQC